MRPELAPRGPFARAAVRVGMRHGAHPDQVHRPARRPLGLRARGRRGRERATDTSGGAEGAVDELLARASAQDAAGGERAEEPDAVDVRDDLGAVRRRMTGDASRATARGEEAADAGQAAEPATGE